MLTISFASPAGTPPGPDELPVIAWDRLLDRFTDLFTRPSSALFLSLVTGWVLCCGRRTVTRMVNVADPDGIHAHDAYHRFLREGRWDMAELWRRLAPLLVSQLEGNLRLVLDLDDTLFHKAGRKVNGAGSFRDPIRSRGQRTVFAHGLNLVVLTLRVQPPWGGEPIGLPINMRRYSKRDGRSLLDLGHEMIEEVAGWLPDHSFILGCDGAYSSLAGRDLPRTHVVSRIQRNAALYDPAPPRRPGQRGRPRKKGARLGTTGELALSADDWNLADIDVRGEQVERALWARPLLWYAVRPLQQVMLVVVADPDQRQHDDLLFCTDLAIPPDQVASLYYGRWSIEDTFRNTKQLLGGRGAPVLEGAWPRAGGRSLLLDLLGDLALVPDLPRRPTDLAHAALVPGQARSLVRRRTGVAPPCPLVAAHFRRFRIGLAHGENPVGAHRRRRRGCVADRLTVHPATGRSPRSAKVHK